MKMTIGVSRGETYQAQVSL